MKIISNYLKNKNFLVTGLLMLFSLVSYGQMLITTTGTPVVQSFTIGSTATAALPSGFKVGNPAFPGVYSSGFTATTLAAGTTGLGVLTGTSGGGTYNFANGLTATATDRAVGFLTTGGFTSPRDLMLQIQNNTAGVISDLAISFDYE